MNKNYINDILSGFLPSRNWNVTAGASGANNTTRFVEAGGARYVLRVYETHRDEGKVRYEHSVLRALQARPLSFCVPEPVVTLCGDTLFRAEDGKLAALFCFSDGTNPSLEREQELYSYGKAVGLLSQTLAGIRTQGPPAYKPYYEIWHAHPRCSLPVVLEFCAGPSAEFAGQERELRQLAKELTLFQAYVNELRHLPHQLVHGDLNASNVLVDEAGDISAILDFEFATYDVRVMEPAVCLADFIRPGAEDDVVWMQIAAFTAGYTSVMRLTRQEAKMLPVLIILRSLDVCLHFLGRYWDGKDEAEMVKQQVKQAVQRAEWLRVHGETLVRLFAG